MEGNAIDFGQAINVVKICLQEYHNPNFVLKQFTYDLFSSKYFSSAFSFASSFFCNLKIIKSYLITLR